MARDAAGRAAGCRAEIDFALAQQPLAAALLRLHEEGSVPERITHNDTKLNNVLLDDATGEGLAVLDLDTVMPGLGLDDFGDLVRTGATSAGRGRTGRRPRRRSSPDVRGAGARASSPGPGTCSRRVEVDHLVVAGQVMTYESGVRFLTDHLDGDVYFRIHRPGHNLDRARTQFALAALAAAPGGAVPQDRRPRGERDGGRASWA